MPENETIISEPGSGESGRNTPDRPIVAVRDVTFGYKRRVPVLEHVAFDVPQGQSLAILGGNGVGKTTLFGVIVGLLRPWSGEAIINADLVAGMRDVFQMDDQANLAAAMTIRENIIFRAKLMGERRLAAAGRCPDLAHLERERLVRAFDLADRLDTRVGELSGGLRKRAGLVAGLLFDPHVIMLDEPTNAVDPLTRELIIALMRQLRASGRTILTITHDLEYCWEVADRAVVLDGGRIAADMPLADFDGFEAFRRAAMLGRDLGDVDFGIGGGSRNAAGQAVEQESGE